MISCLPFESLLLAWGVGVAMTLGALGPRVVEMLGTFGVSGERCSLQVGLFSLTSLTSGF